MRARRAVLRVLSPPAAFCARNWPRGHALHCCCCCCCCNARSSAAPPAISLRSHSHAELPSGLALNARRWQTDVRRQEGERVQHRGRVRAASGARAAWWLLSSSPGSRYFVQIWTGVRTSNLLVFTVLVRVRESMSATRRAPTALVHDTKYAKISLSLSLSARVTCRSRGGGVRQFGWLLDVFSPSRGRPDRRPCRRPPHVRRATSIVV